jgi:carbonic anhydrase
VSSHVSLRFGGLVLLGGLLIGCSGDDTNEADGADSQGGHDWTYEDVDAWGETCATGDQQSPIDLADATDEDLADLDLAYHASPALVDDTGHTVQVNLDDAGTMTRDGETYTLVQFHFHAPSEHLLDGVPYAAEVHLVHQAEDGTLAVLGILIKEGAADPVIADVLAHVPDESADPAATSEPIDVSAMLPAVLRTFRYDGSLTTPPCSEGVAWSVFREPMTWSADQVADFAALHPDSHRPPQPIGDRVLQHDTN